MTSEPSYELTVLGLGQGRELRGGTHSVMPIAPDYRIQMRDTLMLVGTDTAISRFLSEH